MTTYIGKYKLGDILLLILGLIAVVFIIGIIQVFVMGDPTILLISGLLVVLFLWIILIVITTTIGKMPEGLEKK